MIANLGQEKPGYAGLLFGGRRPWARLNSSWYRQRTSFPEKLKRQAMDVKPIELAVAEFGGMRRISTDLRGDASENSERRRAFPGLPTDRLAEKHAMTNLKAVSAAAMLSLAFATSVFAQAAIQEPGAFAFYYPINDILNGGRPTPAAGPGALTPELFGSGGPAMDSRANGASCERYRSYGSDRFHCP